MAMRRGFFLFIFGVALFTPCFSQNMLLLGSEFNVTKPEFWNVGIGFNLIVINEYFQNDVMMNFGRIRTKDADVCEKDNFLFSLADKFYFSVNGAIAGFRAGVFAALGMYDIVDFPTVYDMFFNTGGFVGVALFPRSLFSLTADISPGYAMAFRLSDGPYINEAGFSLSLSFGLRFNFDKL